MHACTRDPLSPSLNYISIRLLESSPKSMSVSEDTILFISNETIYRIYIGDINYRGGTPHI